MIRLDLVKIFLRSLLIQSSFNFPGMQNLGFAFAIMPLVKRRSKNEVDIPDFLLRHLQQFNTHPYLSAPILGSVAKAEEELATSKDGASIAQLKKALMGPYAAIGDTFFWGSLRPFAAIFAIASVFMGFLWAPVVFIALYEPFHFWIRWKGFIESYRLGSQGFQYMQALNLPAMNPKIRWLSVIGLALLMASWLQTSKPLMPGGFSGTFKGLIMLLMVLLSYWAMRRRIPPLLQLYVLAIVFFLV